jgi:hypothetical protein
VFQKTFGKLMQQEMSRAEFLRFMGGAVLAVVGLTTFLKNLGHLTGEEPAKPHPGASYGTPRR